MNRKEVNQLNMFRAVDQFLTTNSEEFKDYPVIIESGERIKVGIEVIDEVSQTQALGTKVKSGMKKREKAELIATAYKVANAISAHATATNNPELKMIAALDKSTLGRLREIDFNIKIQAIQAAALPVADKLKVWGVTVEEVETLKTKSLSLIQRTPEIRNVKAVSKQASKEVHATVAGIKEEIQETLDPLMKPFSTLKPTLYGQYLNARTIVETAATQIRKGDNTAKESA